MNSQKHFIVVTLFPEMFDSFSKDGVIGRAISSGLIKLSFVNPRDFAKDKHRTVDDRPFGGGPGMVMMVQPLTDAIQAAKAAACGDSAVIYLSPQGEKLNHNGVKALDQYDSLILIAGRYEGIDERVIEALVDIELSIGDFVLSGGEIPAMVVIDAVSRLVPGVLGHHQSAIEDSFVNGLLDHPHYTRPDSFEGKEVPSVLRSGDHKKIKQWRLEQSIQRTVERRPDLIQDLALTEELQELIQRCQKS